MKILVCKRQVCTFLKFGCIFLFLAVLVLISMIYRNTIQKTQPESGRKKVYVQMKQKPLHEFQIKVNSTSNHSVSAAPHFCTFPPWSPKEALEESRLLESIAWPETPSLSSTLTLKETSDPSHSTFTILPRRGGGQWSVGDRLQVMIKMCDFQGHPKKYGGDVLIARLHNPALGAGVAGQVVDHFNGSYSAVFSLLWEGSAQVEVTLVHSSEAVTVLRRLNREQPDRIFFKSEFRIGQVTEATTCNVCLGPSQRPVCNYTDLHTGQPWFCYKPRKLSCDARINHSRERFKKTIPVMERNLFRGGVNMKVSIPASGPANVTVLPKMKDQSEMSSSSVESGPSGYYYHGEWQALGDTKVHHFNTSSAIRQCLKGKVVRMYGDSTIRQWFEHLITELPDLKEFNLGSQKQTGPFLALDYGRSILVTFRCHGPPIRFVNVPTSELRYIANELDKVVGGANTVVIIGIWSHFSTFPIEVYIRRLQSIHRAVVRLLSRAPSTLVVIRTANPKALTLYETITNSDWYSLQRDKVLRAMFKGLNVRLVDAWEMSVAHHLPHSLHPQPPIIKNMINVIMSYICPQKGG